MDKNWTQEVIQNWKNFILLFVLLTVVDLAYGQTSSVHLSNFRVESSERDKVFFDSSDQITGSSTNGFTVTHRDIVGVHINKGKKTGHYFTVNRPFNFWDNNTIRYEGGSNLKGNDSYPLSDFTLEYIENKIPEPKGNGTVYYVSTSGNNGNSGRQQSEAWRTIAFAANKAKAGDIVYIEAGDYGSESAVVANNGTADNPIKFIGYENQPGDTPKLQRSPSTKFDASKMPYIRSTSKSGSGFSAISRQYIIIRNLQVEGYKHTVDIAKASYCIVDNVYARGGKTAINCFPHYRSIQNRVINSYVSNGTHNGVYMTGARHLIDNVYATSLGKPNMDYYLVIVGGEVGIGNHIIRNCEVLRDLQDTHPGHGISYKAQGRDIGYSLVEKSTIRNVGMSLEARHSGSRNNVYKDLYITNEGSRYGKGIQITSAVNSIFERILVENKSYGIKFLGSTEDPKAKDAGRGNLIRNCIFKDNSINLQIIRDLDGQERVPTNNTIANCTFDNAGSMFLFEANELGTGNSIVNSIIHDVKSEFYSRSKRFELSFTYTNFYSSNSSFWSARKASGQGNISQNPGFVNADSGNYKLKSGSPMIDKGKDLESVKSDFSGIQRTTGKGIDLGAHEYHDPNSVSVRADAGKDKIICLGESVTLTASGGDTFEWSNGQKSKSIEVSPTETTVYEVTVTRSGVSDTDRVKVTVNSVDANAGKDVSITQGERVELTASGGEEFLWSTGETTKSIWVDPLETTVYSVTVSTNTCESTDRIKVTVNASPESNDSFEISAGEDQTICLGDSVSLRGQGGGSYSWSNGSNSREITVSPSRTETFVLTVELNGQTKTDEVTVVVENCNRVSTDEETSVEDEQVELEIAEENSPGIKLFPNPTTGIVQVQSSPGQKDMTIHLIGLNGSILLEDSIESSSQNFSKQIDLSRFNKGIYYMRFLNEEYQDVKKIVII